MNFDALDMTILGPAMIAGLLVLATHVPLGRLVLARGIIFIDLAVAQIAGLGVVAAHSFHWDPGSWQVQAVAFCAALLGAFVLYRAERSWPDIQEALIGTTFVLAATAAILFLAKNPQGGEHLKDLLVGQILWVNYEQITQVAVVYAFVGLVWWLGRKHNSGLTFYLSFAIAVTASVQLVGVYLVFASLIIPALGARKLGEKGLLFAYTTGALGYAVGLVASALFDLPSGAVIVWSLAVFAVLFAYSWKVLGNRKMAKV